MIDAIGAKSSEAQSVRRGQLTTYDKLLDAGHEQILYIQWQPHDSPT